MSDLAVVGIGADGWAGLGERARAVLGRSRLIVGSERQLGLLPDGLAPARRWPSPIQPLLDEVIGDERPGTVSVLASGDPMLYGIGATLAERVNSARLTIIPHPSAWAIACARLGWASREVDLVSTVARPLDAVRAWLQPRRRLVIYLAGADGASQLAAMLIDAGYGASRFIVLEQLGGERERIRETTAERWDGRAVDPLYAVAVEAVRDPEAALLPRAPGLPDEAYENDGQLTKRHVRAVTLAVLAPAPHALLWDVGAGSGSIAIEWLRAEPTSQASAIERAPPRAQRAMRNAAVLGVPRLHVITGSAPEALLHLPTPDAVFIGGGVTTAGLVDTCYQALAPGGRLVANAVTLESEQIVFESRERHGGNLTRLSVAHAGPVGSFTAWRPQLPVTQWHVEKSA